MATSILEPDSIPPPNPWPKRIAIAVVVLLVVGGVLYWQLRYYREERLVTSFMEALQAGDYRQAYQIWNPASSYSYQDFLEDWGDTTAFGRVRSYEVVAIGPATGVLIQVPGEEGKRTLKVNTGQGSGLVALVRINGMEPPVRLWVETHPPRLSFPPY